LRAPAVVGTIRRMRLSGKINAPYTYLIIVVLLFTVLPVVHRLVDWRVGYSDQSIISVLPLLAMLPAAAIVLYTGRIGRLPKPLLACVWLWFGGFAFALGVGALSGNAVAALYSFVQFILPALFAIWLVTTGLPPETLYTRFANFLLWLSVPLGLYAALQFVAIPPWDAQWMHDAGMTFIGIPEPFQLRPFSTTNGPPQFGDFLVAVIVLNLPRLRQATPLLFAQLALCVGTLALTQVRADWITLALGVLCFIALSPQRLRNFTLIAVVAGVGAILIVNASSLLGSDAAGAALTSRFSTFSDLGNDYSVNERESYFGDTLNEALQQPIGQGLGVTGSAARLSQSGADAPYDDGYIARFVEMGFFGMACYLATVLLGIGIAFKRWLAFTRAGANEDASVAAALVSMQVVLLVLDASIDHHTNFTGLLFWLTLFWAYSWRTAKDVPVDLKAAA
jgi:putative inorganic carbon (hco3(-)) transporter